MPDERDRWTDKSRPAGRPKTAGDAVPARAYTDFESLTPPPAALTQFETLAWRQDRMATRINRTSELLETVKQRQDRTDTKLDMQSREIQMLGADLGTVGGKVDQVVLAINEDRSMRIERRKSVHLDLEERELREAERKERESERQERAEALQVERLRREEALERSKRLSRRQNMTLVASILGTLLAGAAAIATALRGTPPPQPVPIPIQIPTPTSAPAPTP